MKKTAAIFLTVLFITLIMPWHALAADDGDDGGGGGGDSSDAGDIMSYLELATQSCSAGSGGGSTGWGSLDSSGTDDGSGNTSNCGGSSSSSADSSADSSSDSGSGIGIFQPIACKVIGTFNKTIVPIYCSIISNADYLMAVNAAMMLYMIFLGISFISGIKPIRMGEMMKAILKAVFVYTFAVNADVFFSIVYNMVLETPHAAVRIILQSSANTTSSDGGTNGDFFQYVDQAMGKILSSITSPNTGDTTGASYKSTDLKIFMMGAAIWQLGGDMIGGLFFSVIAGWIFSYFSIMISYLHAMLAMMFTLMLGPFFIPTLLFEKTRYLFEEWIRMLVGYMFEIVLVVAFIIMVQSFFIDFYSQIKNAVESTASMSKSAKQYVEAYDRGADGKDTNGGAYTVSTRMGNGGTQLLPLAKGRWGFKDEMGYTPEEADKYFTQAFGGSYKEKFPALAFNLLVTMAILLMSIRFMKLVPHIAGHLAETSKNRQAIFAAQGNQSKLFGAQGEFSQKPEGPSGNDVIKNLVTRGFE